MVVSQLRCLTLNKSHRSDSSQNPEGAGPKAKSKGVPLRNATRKLGDFPTYEVSEASGTPYNG